MIRLYKVKEYHMIKQNKQKDKCRKIFTTSLRDKKLTILNYKEL